MAAVASLETWDKTILLNNLRVSQKLRTSLISVQGWQIVSWLLFSHSLAGAGINKPENFSLARAAAKIAAGQAGIMTILPENLLVTWCV